MIRVAREADAPALTRIMREEDVGHWQTLLAERRRFTAVVDGDDGVPAGLVSARPGDLDGEGRLSYLFVAPEVQNRGLGSALHDAALEWMARQGFATATLRVATGNDRARRFYEQRGWQLTGEPEFDPWLEREMIDYLRRLSR